MNMELGLKIIKCLINVEFRRSVLYLKGIFTLQYPILQSNGNRIPQWYYRSILKLLLRTLSALGRINLLLEEQLSFKG